MWPQSTLCYQHSTLPLGKASQERQVHSKHPPQHCCPTPASWQQGRNEGPGSALSLQAQIRNSYNEIGGTDWIWHGSKFIHCVCELSSIFSPILHSDQKKGLKKQKITTGSPALSACSWFLFLRNVIIKSRCRVGVGRINAPWVQRFSGDQQGQRLIRLFILNWNKLCPLGKKISNNCEDIIANTDLTFWPSNCLHRSETDSGRKRSSLNCLHNNFAGRVFPFCSRPFSALCAIILCSQNIQQFVSLN